MSKHKRRISQNPKSDSQINVSKNTFKLPESQPLLTHLENQSDETNCLFSKYLTNRQWQPNNSIVMTLEDYSYDPDRKVFIVLKQGLSFDFKNSKEIEEWTIIPSEASHYNNIPQKVIFKDISSGCTFDNIGINCGFYNISPYCCFTNVGDYCYFEEVDDCCTFKKVGRKCTMENVNGGVDFEEVHESCRINFKDHYTLVIVGVGVVVGVLIIQFFTNFSLYYL